MVCLNAAHVFCRCVIRFMGVYPHMPCISDVVTDSAFVGATHKECAAEYAKKEQFKLTHGTNGLQARFYDTAVSIMPPVNAHAACASLATSKPPSPYRFYLRQ